MDEPSAVVFDVGSRVFKAGFAGDDGPRAAFPSFVGCPRQERVMCGLFDKESRVGFEAESLRGFLTLKYPVSHGVVTSWDDMQTVFHHAFYNEMRVSPEDHALLLTEPPLNPKSNRETAAELMYETYDVPALHFEMGGALAMYTSGRTTGVVLDVGDGVSHAVPFHRGIVHGGAIQRSDFAGRDVTVRLMGMLRERGYSFGTTAEQDVARELKEKHAYVAAAAGGGVSGGGGVSATESGECDYVLPDENVLKLGDERHLCAEALFDPSLAGSDCVSVQGVVHAAIEGCEPGVRDDLYGSIYLCGGTTKMRGFDSRLESEVAQLSPSSDISVETLDEHAVWIGGSILCSMPTVSVMWVSKSEYDEVGAASLHRKGHSMGRYGEE